MYSPSVVVTTFSICFPVLEFTNFTSIPDIFLSDDSLDPFLFASNHTVPFISYDVLMFWIVVFVSLLLFLSFVVI